MWLRTRNITSNAMCEHAAIVHAHVHSGSGSSGTGRAKRRGPWRGDDERLEEEGRHEPHVQGGHQEAVEERPRADADDAQPRVSLVEQLEDAEGEEVPEEGPAPAPSPYTQETTHFE